MIRLDVSIRIGERNRAEFEQLAGELVAASRHDEGCVDYDLFRSATRPDVLMICETWRDEEALAAHGRTPHFRRIVPRLHELAEMTSERFPF